MLIPAATLEDTRPATLDGGSPVRTVIIPIDGSELSEAVLPVATALGEAFGAEYILFRAVPPPTYPPMPADTGPVAVLMSEYRERDVAATRRAMHAIASRMREAGLSTTVMLEEEADPTRALLRLAEATTPAAVIAMATHGRGGLRRAVLGSVTDKIVRAGPRPVLIVRPSGMRAPEGPAAERAPSRRPPDRGIGWSPEGSTGRHWSEGGENDGRP